jgi:hypothetical protein
VVGAVAGRLQALAHVRVQAQVRGAEDLVELRHGAGADHRDHRRVALHEPGQHHLAGGRAQLGRHLRAARKRYRQRRDRPVRALAERLPDTHLLGVAASLHVLVHLDGAVDCAAVVGRAAASGMRVANLDTYRCRDDPTGPGLVLGYGNLADGQLDEAVVLLATAVAESRRVPRES